MGISIIRKATAEDEAAVRATAERFCRRHEIDFGTDWPAEEAIRYAIETGGPQGDTDRRLKKLWTACYCRALGLPTRSYYGTAYGYVGILTD
ncbi:MAG TPA: hypothetical protein DCZ11_08890 [Gammaproteobacteria bacterium]|nr:hypothetical protein [Gammaproteobacteria bacterium]MCH78545.1 hypothetical protein [Gammaproteobacteria bacterium]